jgi:hypothetical protein
MYNTNIEDAHLSLPTSTPDACQWSASTPLPPQLPYHWVTNYVQDSEITCPHRSHYKPHIEPRPSQWEADDEPPTPCIPTDRYISVR